MEPDSFEPQLPSAPRESPSVEDAAVAAAPRRDLWGYWDLTGFLLFALVALGICAVAAAVLSAALINFFGIHAPLAEPPYMVHWALGIQALWWALLFVYFYYVISIRYKLPFWKALGFLPYRAPTAWFVVLGIMLAFGVGITGQLIEAPTETPLKDMLSDPDTMWLMGLFAVLIGPVVEEITFRGFLFRPIERAHGALAAIIVTSAIFTAPHGDQYDWHWQILVLLFAAGASFGFVRWKTGSLWPAIVMHIAYNGIQFAAFVFRDELGTE